MKKLLAKLTFMVMMVLMVVYCTQNRRLARPAHAAERHSARADGAVPLVPLDRRRVRKILHLTTKTRTNPNPPPPPFLSIAAYDRDIAAFARARGAGRAAAARGALRALEREARVTSAN